MTLETLTYQGIYSKVEEIDVIPKNAKRPTIGITNGIAIPMCANMPHNTLKVTLANKGGQFALDLSSAQYGFYEPITIWDEYMQQRIHHIRRSRPNQYEYFGGGRAIFRLPIPRVLNDFNSEWRRLVSSLSEKASGWLCESVKGWEDKNILVSKLLNLPQQEYEQKMKGLIDHIDGELTEQVQVLKAKCQEQKKIKLAKRDKDAGWECVLLKEPQTEDASIFGDTFTVHLFD
jgi:hypothetical protein